MASGYYCLNCLNTIRDELTFLFDFPICRNCYGGTITSSDYTIKLCVITIDELTTKMVDYIVNLMLDNSDITRMYLLPLYIRSILYDKLVLRIGDDYNISINEDGYGQLIITPIS